MNKIPEIVYTCSHCQETKICSDFKVNLLDFVRRLSFQPIFTSGYRCVIHNAAEGGSAVSAHMKGKAADIAYSNMHQLFEIIDSALKSGFNRIFLYKTKDIIHIDADSSLPFPRFGIY